MMTTMGFDGTVMVVGGGAFGSLAVRAAEEAGADVLVIDADPRCEAEALIERRVDEAGFEGGSALMVADWRTCFREAFYLCRPSWTVPAVPGHMLGMVALEELVEMHGLVGFAPSGRLGPLAPHVLRDDPSIGLLVTSYMHGGRCMKDCGQPKVCPVTGEERPVPMHSMMDAYLEERTDRHDVLVSVDVGGVGAIAFEDLRACLRNMEDVREGETYGIATSCRCHAVTNLFHIP